MQKKRVFKGKQKFKGWTILKRISGGGNGDVWICENRNGEKRAIKLLKKSKDIAVQRFKDEVKTLLNNQEIKGVIEIVDFYLPKDAINEVPFYVMPLGNPLSSIIESIGLKEKIILILDIAKTLQKLHEKGICHRDIKPSNIIALNKIPHLIDFGLVTFKEKAEITREKEQIGPRWTIAPEIIRRDEDNYIDYFKADIYSLAKTLWIILTGKEVGFEGQYSEKSVMSIKKIYPNEYLTTIEKLLSQSTQNLPMARPTILSFVENLQKWLILHEDFYLMNIAQWEELLKKLFPVTIHQRVSWHDREEIIKVLNILGETQAINHMFFPDSGGLDLTGAKKSFEEGCIELDCGGSFSILKPKRLMFESFGDDAEWNYFRLEIDDYKLKPIEGIYIGENRHQQELSELEPGVYEDYIWLENYYEENGHSYSQEARTVSRYIKGSFVIFGKSSIYNKVSSTYDARHNKMTADEFRSYIKRSVEHKNK